MQQIRNRGMNTGFATIELIVVVVVIAVIAFGGFTLMKRRNDKTANSQSNADAASLKQPAKASAQTAPAISQTSIDNVLAGAAAEDEIEQGYADQAATDAAAALSDANNLEGAANASF